jgi:hypothetical protein
MLELDKGSELQTIALWIFSVKMNNLLTNNKLTNN